ncbi:hypothetical protein HYH02_009835 [Chlamydomonas schloesseri]|uniref:non-specific serine/threonine protein kinase n=1 Tax=Chlamydomonas schloesseri TaxID=2026947 RepID=A0A835TBC9_9CHLO|nr:hypothetical protein HYH02_009835 [Chlamydomonas schloesseri]|eukprot:KAG2442043.1 hypothetical protein HYH02_009835 [Chlamydomonas schloesseri]
MDAYQELKLIGKGTYGKVYKVRSKVDDDVCVIKKVQFDGTPQTEAEAALREGQVLSLLRHPHVVPYKEFFKHTDGDLCLVMAFCEGGDLFKYIRELRDQGKTVPEPQVWAWLVQLLLSLSYIHSKRILHRDVKTQNIFLSGGKVLLGDFGLAKQLQRTFEMARTPIGTPYYMAPEIYEEQPYSFKSDVWALGCVMYEMMTGRAAFAADNLSRVVLRVIRGQYDPLPDTYSSALRMVVTSMLCKEVRARPDANQLLTVPAVVPHVQSYLESLTAEGPSGWATWRMKLPLTAMVQMSEALEAAGVPFGGRRSHTGGGGTLPPSNRTSVSGAAGPTPQLSLDPEPLQEEPSLSPEPPAGGGGGLAPATPEQRQGGSAPYNGVVGGQVVKLPPLPGVKPVRTPYGLATPFMGGAATPPQHYAELQVLAHQVMAIRTSQCGDSAGNSESGAAAAGPDGALEGGGAGTTAGLAPGDEVPEVVKALDRTLIKTLEVARRATEADSGGPDAGGGGGGGGGGGIDEAWLSAGLPQGGFGFGGGGFGAPPPPAPAPKPSKPSDVVSLPPIARPRPISAKGLLAAGGATSEPPTPSANAPARAVPYGVPDEGFASLSHVSLHAQSLVARRANLEAYCGQLLGPDLMEQVMQAVSEAQKTSATLGGAGGVEAAEAALARQLDRLLAGGGAAGQQLRAEVGPLLEELALLHVG